MNFLYVASDDLQKAKKRVVKNMKRNAASEPRYAMPEGETNKYDEYLKAVVDLNDRLYTLQTELEQRGAKQSISRGIIPALDALIRVTPRLKVEDLSNAQKGELEGYATEISGRREGIEANGLRKGTASVRQQNQDILNLLDTFLNSLSVLLSQPEGYTDSRKYPMDGSGFMMPRHQM